jgi:hypothetical protein
LRALQSVRIGCWIGGISATGHPPGLAARSALSSATVSRYWFSDPTLPLTVVSAVWFSRCRTLLIAVKQVNKRSALRVYLPREFCPANPSRLAAACQLLSWALRPYSTYRIEGPLFAGLPARCVPSSGFGYPRDGLRPSVPRRLCFAPAALLGFTLRSFLLSRGTRAFPPECTHLPFRSHDTGRKRRADMAAAVSGFSPSCRVPGGPRVFNTSTAGCSLGFSAF